MILLFLESWPVIVRVQTVISIILLLSFFIFSCSILIQRTRKNNLGSLSFQIIENYEEIVSNVIFDDTFEEKYMGSKGKKELWQVLLGKYNNKLLYKEILIEVLIDLLKNLSGIFADRVIHIYKIIELDKHSLKKLESPKWEIKTRAVIELSEMKVESAYRNIATYINHPNIILRSETRKAFVKFTPRNLNLFIKGVNSSISYWEMMNLIDVIDSRKNDYLPHFHPDFNSKNQSMIYFCLKVINYFKLVDYLDDVMLLIKHTDEEIRKLVIASVGLLGGYNKIWILKERFRAENENMQLEIINTFSLIADNDDVPFLLNIACSDYSNRLRLASLKGILNLGDKGIPILNELRNNSNDQPLVQMIAHTVDSRIL